MPTQLAQLGESTALKARFLEEDGTTAEVTGVTLHLRRPNGTLVNPIAIGAPVTEAGVVKWRHDYVPDLPGIWHYEFRAENPAAVATGAFVVEPSAT